MSKTQIILAVVLVLSIVALFLPWVEASVTVDAVEQSTTNYGYNYIVPGGAPFAAPVGILCVIGFILSAYSFKARDKIRKLNVIAGILILVGAIAAFAYTTSAAMAEASGAASFSVDVSGAYGMGLEILFGVLMIIFGAGAKPNTVKELGENIASSLSRLFKNFRFGLLPVPGRIIAIVFFIVLFIIPLINDSKYALFVLTTGSLLVIFAVSWDLLSGYSGQVNFGHALFFGVSAYTVALLHKYFDLQPWATIPIATLVAVGIGVLTSIPALRLRGPYLSLLTMAFPLMLLGLVMAFKDWTGGEFGIPGIPPLAGSHVSEYYICLIVMTVSVLIMWKLTDAGSKFVRTGLIFHAIREDEIAARASGINTINYKILAFVIGGFFAGLAGALYAHVLGTVSISYLSMTMSFRAIIYVVFGGIVSIYGPVVGVYTLQTLLQFAGQAGQNFLGQNQILIMSVIVILVLIFMPEGVAVWIRDKIERECPRCKLSNAAWRKECRACSAPLH